MKLSFGSIMQGVCCIGIISVIASYIRNKREEKQIHQSLENLRGSLLARAEMDRRVNFYHNNYEKESK